MKTARIAVPDLVSNSYFPAIAAITLDCFKQEALHAVHELIFPNYKAYEALRDGKIDFVAAPAHAALLAFPEWSGAKMLAALSQGMFWLLVMRSDLGATPGDIGAVKGRTIGAAPLVSLGLQQMLIESGIDLERDAVRIVGVPGANEPGVSFGVVAAEALEQGKLDGFWANAMGAENAVRSGVGKVVLDVRRGVGPAFAFHHDAGARHERPQRRARPRHDCGWNTSHCKRPTRAQSGCLVGDQSRSCTVSPTGGGADCGRGRARSAILRPCDFQRGGRGDESVRSRGGPHARIGQLRAGRRDTVSRLVDQLIPSAFVTTRSVPQVLSRCRNGGATTCCRTRQRQSRSTGPSL